MSTTAASQETRTLRYALPLSLGADVAAVLVDSGRATGCLAHPTASMWGAEGGESASFRFNFGGGGDDDNVGGGGGGGGDDGESTAATTAAAAVAAEDVIHATEVDASLVPDLAFGFVPEEVTIAGRIFVKGASSGAAALCLEARPCPKGFPQPALEYLGGVPEG